MVLNNPSILGRSPGHLERAGGHIVRFEVGRRPRLNKHAENQSTNRKKWGPRSGSPTAPETSPISRVPCGSLLASSRPVAAAEGIACFGFIRHAYCQAQNHSKSVPWGPVFFAPRGSSCGPRIGDHIWVHLWDLLLILNRREPFGDQMWCPFWGPLLAPTAS